jgi:DNA-directed RNA polymerase specialized sigma subunit
MTAKTAPKEKVKAKRKSSSDRHYIDDTKFHKALSDYKASVDEAKANDMPKPMVPDYIAQSLMMLARKIARKPGFSRYPFVEDMIGDAILCCFKNIHNFNPKHPTAFPYFTQIVHYSFIQRILREHTALYRKFRAIMERQKELCGDTEAESVQVYGSRYSDLQMREFCEKFEKRLEEKRLKSKQRKKANASKIEFDAEAAEGALTEAELE